MEDRPVESVNQEQRGGSPNDTEENLHPLVWKMIETRDSIEKENEIGRAIMQKAEESEHNALTLQAKAEQFQLEIVQKEMLLKEIDEAAQGVAQEVELAKIEQEDALKLLSELQALVRDKTAALEKKKQDLVFTESHRPEVSKSIYRSRLEFDRFRKMAETEKVNAMKYITSAQERQVQKQLDFIDAQIAALESKEDALIWSQVANIDMFQNLGSGLLDFKKTNTGNGGN